MLTDLRQAFASHYRNRLMLAAVLALACSLPFLLGAGCDDSGCVEPSCYEAAAEACGGTPAANFVCPWDEELECNVLVHVECGDGTILSVRAGDLAVEGVCDV